MFTNSNWFAFQDDRTGGSESTATSSSDVLNDLKLSRISNGGGNSSSDDEVVVGEIEELSSTKANASSNAGTNPFNELILNDSSGGEAAPMNELFRFEAPDNDDPFEDRPMPEWVAWGEVSDFQVGGSGLNPFEEDPSQIAENNSNPISTTSSGDSMPNGASSSDSPDSNERSVAAPSLFEEDVEFVGVELEGTEKAMEHALKEGIVGEAGPLKRSIVPKKVENEESDDGGGGMKEFNDANYWRVDQEVTVLE